MFWNHKNQLVFSLSNMITKTAGGVTSFRASGIKWLAPTRGQNDMLAALLRRPHSGRVATMLLCESSRRMDVPAFHERECLSRIAFHRDI